MRPVPPVVAGLVLRSPEEVARDLYWPERLLVLLFWIRWGCLPGSPGEPHRVLWSVQLARLAWRLVQLHWTCPSAP